MSALPSKGSKQRFEMTYKIGKLFTNNDCHVKGPNAGPCGGRTPRHCQECGKITCNNHTADYPAFHICIFCDERQGFEKVTIE